jgi:NADH dehydrogenase
VSGFEDVWAIGDNASVPDENGDPHSATAQTAVQQAEHLARNIARALAGRPLEPFRFNNSGALAALGCRTGVAKVIGFKLSGFAAWFLWRTVYLMKMPGIRRKARVAIDWTVDLLFGREFVQFGLPPHPPEPADAARPEDDVARTG